MMTRNQCLRCGGHCSLRPALGPRQLWVEIAGMTCTAFSSFGLQWRWADPSAIPCLIWAMWCAHEKPDVILAECVGEFETTPIEEIFHEYHFVKNKVCPSQLGWPCRRRRFYGAWVKKETMTILGTTIQTAPSLFAELFHHEIIGD
eukprot:11182731-Lingulodinium_polyedra.AAC.1